MTDKAKEKNTKNIFDRERLPMYKHVYMYAYVHIDHKRTPWCDIFSSVIGAAYHCRGETGRKRMKVKSEVITE